MRSSQWLMFGMGSVVAGLTIWQAAFGDLPGDLGQIITGTLLSVACILWALVGLEDKEE